MIEMIDNDCNGYVYISISVYLLCVCIYLCVCDYGSTCVVFMWHPLACWNNIVLNVTSHCTLSLRNGNVPRGKFPIKIITHIQFIVSY